MGIQCGSALLGRHKVIGDIQGRRSSRPDFAPDSLWRFGLTICLSLQETVFPSSHHRHPLTPVRTFDCSEHHRQAMDVIGTACLCRYPLSNIPEKLRHHAKVAASFPGIRLLRRNERFCFVEQPIRLRGVFAADLLKAVPKDRSLCADDPPSRVPRGPQPF